MNYYYFNLNGCVVSMRQDTARTLMERIAPEWKKVHTRHGTLYQAVYDWYGEMVDGEYTLFPPRLKDGTAVPINKTARQFLSLDIHGECFLQPHEHTRDEVLTFVMQDHVRYEVA